MSRKGVQIFKCIWISLTVSAFVFPLLTADTRDTLNMYGSFNSPTDNMIFFMAFLSFPANLLFLACIEGLSFWAVSRFDSTTYLTFWLMLFLAGYLQWFWLLPRLFGQNKLTILNLTQAKVENVKVEEKARRRYFDALRHPEKRVTIRIFRVSHFDEQGCTPLERVIGSKRF